MEVVHSILEHTHRCAEGWLTYGERSSHAADFVHTERKCSSMWMMMGGHFTLVRGDFAGSGVNSPGYARCGSDRASARGEPAPPLVPGSLQWHCCKQGKAGGSVSFGHGDRGRAVTVDAAFLNRRLCVLVGWYAEVKQDVVMCIGHCHQLPGVKRKACDSETACRK